MSRRSCCRLRRITDGAACAPDVPTAILPRLPGQPRHGEVRLGGGHPNTANPTRRAGPERPSFCWGATCQEYGGNVTEMSCGCRPWRRHPVLPLRERSMPEAFRDSSLGRRHPAIARSREAHWEQVVPFFSFTAAVRQVIYTTNAIESLNSCVRRAVAARGHFRSDKAAAKLIYMALRNVERKWKAPRPSGTRPAASSPSSSKTASRCCRDDPPGTAASARSSPPRPGCCRPRPLLSQPQCAARALALWSPPASLSLPVRNPPWRCATVATHTRDF